MDNLMHCLHVHNAGSTLMLAVRSLQEPACLRAAALLYAAAAVEQYDSIALPMLDVL